MKVQIKGLNSLVKKINNLGGNAEKALKIGMGKGMELIKGDAKDLCPVDSGDLQNSINSQVKNIPNGIQGSVGTNKEYAAYVEFGTGQRGAESPSPPKAPIVNGYKEDWKGMPAQPFLYPALMQNKENVKELCIEELNKEIRRMGGR